MGSEGQSWNGFAASDGGGEGKPTPATAVAPAQVEVPTSAADVDILLPLPEMMPHIMVLCKDLVKGWSSLDSSCFSIETVSGSITNLCVKLDVVSYDTIINGHCLAGKMDEAMDLLDDRCFENVSAHLLMAYAGAYGRCFENVSAHLLMAYAGAFVLKISVKGTSNKSSVTVWLYGPNTDLVIDQKRELQV